MKLDTRAIELAAELTAEEKKKEKQQTKASPAEPSPQSEQPKVTTVAHTHEESLLVTSIVEKRQTMGGAAAAVVLAAAPNSTTEQGDAPTARPLNNPIDETPLTTLGDAEILLPASRPRTNASTNGRTSGDNSPTSDEIQAIIKLSAEELSLLITKNPLHELGRLKSIISHLYSKVTSLQEQLTPGWTTVSDQAQAQALAAKILSESMGMIAEVERVFQRAFMIVYGELCGNPDDQPQSFDAVIERLDKGTLSEIQRNLWQTMLVVLTRITRQQPENIFKLYVAKDFRDGLYHPPMKDVQGIGHCWQLVAEFVEDPKDSVSKVADALSPTKDAIFLNSLMKHKEIFSKGGEAFDALLKAVAENELLVSRGIPNENKLVIDNLAARIRLNAQQVVAQIQVQENQANRINGTGVP